MNYYERWLGDYGRDTGHLSLAEHGAYTVLLDTYYSTEAPLPADYQTLYRICRAMDKPEQDAVRKVADQFFPVSDDGLRHNPRADLEVTKAHTRINTARANGSKGGKKPKPNPSGIPSANPTGMPEQTQDEPTGNPMGYPTVTQPGVHHMPHVNLNPSQEERALPETPTPTTAGLLCARLRKCGIASVNPSNPKLLALLEAGLTVEEIGDLADEPGSRGKPFAWILAAAEGRRRDAVVTQLPPPKSSDPKEFERRMLGI